MKITTDEVVEGIKVAAAAATPVVVALGISAGDVTTLSESAQAFVIAGSATLAAARVLAGAIIHRS